MSTFYNDYKKEPEGFEGKDTFVLMQEPDVLGGPDEGFNVVYNPIKDQARRLEEKEDAEKAAAGNADPTSVCLNRSEYRGTYIDGETGKRFRPGVPTEVGKIHAQRLLSLRSGRLFSAC
jgi:hypothetical protein